jgi:hypothetical protein
MNEKLWLACDDPMPMEDFLKGRGCVSNRRWRLWSCACIRRIWHLLADPRCRKSVEVAEAFADGAADRRQLKLTHQAAGRAWLKLRNEMDGITVRAMQGRGTPEEGARHDALAPSYYGSLASHAVTLAREHRLFAGHAAACVVIATEEGVAGTGEAGDQERAAQADLLRCVMGNPFSRLQPLPASLLHWNSGIIPQMANAIYEERDLPSGHLAADRLAVLADCLEDAGYSDALLLGHLRGGGVHVRGCWAVDLLLGKT